MCTEKTGQAHWLAYHDLTHVLMNEAGNEKLSRSCVCVCVCMCDKTGLEVSGIRKVVEASRDGQHG